MKYLRPLIILTAALLALSVLTGCMSLDKMLAAEREKDNRQVASGLNRLRDKYADDREDPAYPTEAEERETYRGTEPEGDWFQVATRAPEQDAPVEPQQVEEPGQDATQVADRIQHTFEDLKFLIHADWARKDWPSDQGRLESYYYMSGVAEDHHNGFIGIKYFPYDAPDGNTAWLNAVQSEQNPEVRQAYLFEMVNRFANDWGYTVDENMQLTTLFGESAIMFFYEPDPQRTVEFPSLMGVAGYTDRGVVYTLSYIPDEELQIMYFGAFLDSLEVVR